MNARCIVILGSALFALLSTSALANVFPEKLPDTKSQDWSGSLMRVPLSDGSQLNEYVARTMAGSVAGTYLAVSFMPRFDCTPVISLNVDAAAGLELDENTTVLDLSVDQQPIQFSVLRDVSESAVRLTFNADHTETARLLATLDISSRASLNLSPVASADAVIGTTDSTSAQIPSERIEFSLLGSTLSTQAVKDHCLAHIPIPFDN